MLVGFSRAFLRPPFSEDIKTMVLVDARSEQWWVRALLALLGSAMWGWLATRRFPRLPRRIDPSLQRVATRAQLDDAVARGSAGREQLAERAWKAEGKAEGEHYERQLGEKIVRVLQFNTLAHGLSALPTAPMPFAAAQPSASGGFDQVEQPEETLNWESRRWAVLAEMLRHDADVLTLQEIDHFADFFEPALAAAGYDCLFQPVAPPGPGEKFGGYTDGVAVAWRRQRFAVARVNAMRSSSCGRASIVLTLASRRASSHQVVLACTHLTSKTGQQKEDLRARQVGALIADVERARSAAIAGSRARSGETAPLILAGDLNTDPHDVSAPKPHVAKAIPMILEYGLQSAYPLSPHEGAYGPGSETWTTWKRRGAYEAKHQIDFIFSAGARHIARLRPPSDGEVGEARLPSLRYPSDHIAVAADLLISDWPS